MSKEDKLQSTRTRLTLDKKKKIYKLQHGQECGTSRQRTKRSRNINNVVSHHEKGKIVEKEGSNSGDRMLWQWSEKNWKKENRTI